MIRGAYLSAIALSWTGLRIGVGVTGGFGTTRGVGVAGVIDI